MSSVLAYVNVAAGLVKMETKILGQTWIIISGTCRLVSFFTVTDDKLLRNTSLFYLKTAPASPDYFVQP